MLASGFEQVDGSECVHFKIEDRNVAGLVMRRLRRTMDDQIESIALEKFLQGSAIADIQTCVLKILCRALQPIEIPCGVALRAKKKLAHVVVHTDDAMALAVKMLDRFRAN